MTVIRCKSMRVPCAIALSLVVLASCVHRPTYQGGTFATAPQVLLPDDRGYPTPLAAGQSLSAGQVFALELSLQQPAYVYVLKRSGGVLDSLFPGASDSDRVEGPGVVRIPSTDSWLRTPQLDGHGRLCVLLSAQPLDPAQRQCSAHREHMQLNPPIQSFQLAPLSAH